MYSEEARLIMRSCTSVKENDTCHVAHHDSLTRAISPH